MRVPEEPFCVARPENYSANVILSFFLLLFFKASRDLRRYDHILSYEKKLLGGPASRNHCP